MYLYMRVRFIDSLNHNATIVIHCSIGFSYLWIYLKSPSSSQIYTTIFLSSFHSLLFFEMNWNFVRIHRFHWMHSKIGSGGPPKKNEMAISFGEYEQNLKDSNFKWFLKNHFFGGLILSAFTHSLFINHIKAFRVGSFMKYE